MQFELRHIRWAHGHAEEGIQTSTLLVLVQRLYKLNALKLASLDPKHEAHRSNAIWDEREALN